jgi:hypothetical protein
MEESEWEFREAGESLTNCEVTLRAAGKSVNGEFRDFGEGG